MGSLPSSNRPKISLLHATYRRAGGPIPVRDSWLANAVDPSLVEYVIAMDADDDISVRATEGIPRVLNPPVSGTVTAVRNWNAAAAASRGDLLFVIADDVFPPPGWDRSLLALIRPLDPLRDPFAVKLSDGPSSGTLLRHPVISRAFYERMGLFSSRYSGVYCDDDLTTRAYWRAVIIDGRALILDHRHPSLLETTWSLSQLRINNPAEYARGRSQYTSTWSRRKRLARVRFLGRPLPSRFVRSQLALTRWMYHAVANIRFARGCVRDELTAWMGGSRMAANELPRPHGGATEVGPGGSNPANRNS